MLKLYYQYYPTSLKDLISVEEAIIVKAHSIVINLKLKPNKSFNLETYRNVCRHFMLLPQNLRSLFTLLPLKMTSIDHIVQVVWTSKMLIQSEQLSKFVSI